MTGARIATAHRHAVADIERMIGGERNRQPKTPREGWVQGYRIEASRSLYAKDGCRETIVQVGLFCRVWSHRPPCDWKQRRRCSSFGLDRVHWAQPDAPRGDVRVLIHQSQNATPQFLRSPQVEPPKLNMVIPLKCALMYLHHP